MGRLHTNARACLVMAAFLCCGCTNGDIASVPCEPTAASLERHVIRPGCALAGCHAATDPAVGLDLEKSGALEALVLRPSAVCDGTLVVPGHPEESMFYEKLAAEAPRCGARMPVGGALAHEELACVADWIAALPTGCETCGGSTCVDVVTSTAHCGACDNACPAGARCQEGACVCDDGLTPCAGACIDTMANPDHCGGCGQSCDAPLLCSLGSCKETCDIPLVACGGACVNVQTSEKHCGGCNNPCGLSQSCSDGLCACTGGSVSFATGVQPIFDVHCATSGCHRSPTPKEGLDLTDGQAWTSLVDVESAQCADGRVRVSPGNPQDSYLLHKLLGVELCSGTKMPKLEVLPEGDIDTVAAWICAGAPND